MSLKTSSGGWRGISSTKEATFGTPVTVDTSLNFSGEFVDAAPEKVWDDKDENTGELAPTRIQVLTNKSDGKHTQNLMSHNAGIFLAWLFGNCVTTDPSDPLQSSVRKHKIVTDKDVIELVSRTMREWDGVNVMEYAGMICTEVSIEAAREDHAKLSATLAGMGKELVITPASSRPAQVLEDYLCYGDITLKKGGTYNGTTVTGGTDISARVLNFKLDMKNAGKLRYLFGDATKNAGGAIRGRMLDISLEMKMEFQDRTEKQSLLDGTTFVMEIPMVGKLIGLSTTNAYTVRCVLPKVGFNKVKRSSDDGLLILDAGFRVLADATYGPIHFHLINEQTAYL